MLTGSVATSSGLNLAGTGATFDISGTTAGATIQDLRGVTGTTVTLGGQTLTVGTSNSTTFGGVIQGSGGGLTKQGTGTLTLTGANTYSGATTINAGILQAGAANAFSASSAVTVNGGTLDFNNFNNTIAGLNGAGGVTLGSGTLTVSGGGTYNGAISGTGGLTLTGGTLTLTGTSTYSGATTITGGTLDLNLDAPLSTQTAVTVNGGVLQLDLNVTQTVKSLSLQGSGVALQMSNDTVLTTAALSGTGGIFNNGNLIFGSDNTDQTYSGNITGAGNLTKTGTGTETLSGTSSYAVLNINGGTVKVASDAPLGSASGGLTLNGGTLETTAGFTTSRVVNLAGAGTFQVDTGTLQIDGLIANSGSLTKTGSGTLTLTHSNTYTGATIVNAGTLALTGSGSIATSSGLNLAGVGATFDISGLSGTNTAISNLSGVAGTTVALGGKTLQINQSVNTTFAGVFTNSAGGGQIDKAGTGTLTLTGANTYSDQTNIEGGGTLQAGGTNVFSASSNYTLIGSGSTLDLNDFNNTVGQLNAGAGAATLGTATLTVSNGGLFGGGADISGTGGLTLAGGTFTVSTSSALSYTGATTVSGGTLQLSAAGSIANSSGLTLSGAGATFDISSTTSGTTIKDLAGVAGTFVTLGSKTLTAGTGNSTTFAGVVQGSGGITKQGSGTLTLSGANSYSGATTVNGGTLALSGSGSLAASSGVNLAVSGAGFDVSGASGGVTIKDLSGVSGTTVALGANTLTVGSSNDTTFIGAIGGTGGLTKQGAGTLILDGTNTYGGTTTINAGTLQLGEALHVGALAGSVIINSGGTFSFAQGDLSAVPTITTNSGGILNITDATVSTTRLIANAGGSVNVTATGVSVGSIEGAGSYSFGPVSVTTGSNNLSTEVSGAITGGGTLVKTGTGTLTLSGADTVNLTVNGGTALVTNTLAGTVTVGSGGTLMGTGTITGNVTVNGTIRPDIGTTNIVGTYTQGAGSTYTVEVTPGGLSDKINVTGNAVINGGTVAVMADAGTYQRRTTYTILTATTGVTGTYGDVTSNMAFLTPTLSYDTNDVFLTLFQSSSAFAAGGQTGNQKSVGHALDLANPTATGDFNTVLNALSLLSTAQGPVALDGISGLNYAGFGTLSVQAANAFMTAFGQQVGHGHGNGHVALASSANDACDFSCEVEPRWGTWMGGFGGLGTVAGDANTHGSTYNLGGAAVGLDYKFDPQFTAGVTLGYSTSTLWTSGMPGQGTSDQVQMGLYGQYTQGALYVDGLAGYAHGQNRMTRPILIPGLNARTAQGNTSVEQFFGLVETGYKVEIGGTANAFVTPFARLQGATATQAAFTETGADSLDLNVAQQTTNSLRTVLGAQVGATLAKVDVKLQAGWSHELADTSRPVTASFAGAPAFGFTTQGAVAPRDGAVVGAMASAMIDDRTSLYARYDGDFEGGTTSHSFFAGLRLTW